MLKIKSNHSITLSIILSVLFFVGCGVGVFYLPTLTEILIDVSDNIGSRGEITEGGRIFVLCLAYGILAILILANSLLFSLLLRVRAGLVFTEKSVALIRGVAWCCLLLGIVFGLLGIYFQLSFIVAFAAIFLGICLRVVKNVIEEATEIKSENDLTV